MISPALIKTKVGMAETLYLAATNEEQARSELVQMGKQMQMTDQPQGTYHLELRLHQS